MSTLAYTNIVGTGAGTGIKAATDVAMEAGLTEAGGYPLISDFNDTRYIGHGVAHRDPRTGEPLPAHIHIPTDGELNPKNYVASTIVYEDPAKVQQHTRDAFLLKYNKKSASHYRSNYFNFVGSVQSKLGQKEAGQRKLERAKLERAAYDVDYNAMQFCRER
ncbi:hypothetical protein LPJ66_001841 [Kickxella alabastrina]|uniref:Uncharacterized protein n=1 Tax=Kickxella alabastrina TaxID=61397 RepID=A0ACC1IS58_9FUNG|nr:hypothetical protein LPJ66_001841 [Kickxella alabastrina]